MVGEGVRSGLDADLNANIRQKITFRRGLVVKGMRPLNDEEVQVISETFAGKYENRDRALFLLGVKSGFRISELLSLRIGDIYSNGRIADRVYVARRNMKKKLEGRSVILHPDAKAALETWLNELWASGYRNSDCYVFQSRKGDNAHISKVHAWRVLNTAAGENELSGPIGTHSMRKTFASRVYDKLDHDLVKTQAALGHKNINSTVNYLSFKQEEIDEAILAV